MRSPTACATALALTAAAAAQTTAPLVDPAPFGALPTALETGLPFGYPTRQVLRYQEIHDGLAGRARTIRAIALRRRATDVAAAPAFTADVSLRLSTARHGAASIRREFLANEGLDARTVLPPRTRVSFPATKGPYTTTAPFAYRIPARAPYAFGGKGPLCVELSVAAHTNRTAIRFSLYAEGRQHLGAAGKSCAGTSLATVVTAKTVRHAASGLPASAPVVLMIGRDLDRLGSTPLPLDLTSLGAPGCSLSLAPAMQVLGFADAKGDHALEVSRDAVAPGAYWAAQVAAIDPAANALGAVFTQTRIVLLASPRVAGRVWAEKLDAERGLAQPVYALVLAVE